MPVITGVDPLLAINLRTIIKRDGTKVAFDIKKIEKAIDKAIIATGGTTSPTTSVHNSRDVVAEVMKLASLALRSDVKTTSALTVEVVQDYVEQALMTLGMHSVAKAYIIYRNDHTKRRLLKKPVSNNLRALYDESIKYFDSIYEYIIYLRTYSRWIETEGRRETWVETVQRFITFARKKLGAKLDEKEYDIIQGMILRHEIMPSMRLLQCAGPAAERENMTGYNCCFVAPTCIEDLRDLFYISMCGTGVGFSCETQFVEQFPMIKQQSKDIKDHKIDTFVVPDCKEGWADALYTGMKKWYDGNDLIFDYSKIRKAGERLKTMGGRASGPQPLKDLLDYCRTKILGKQGIRLSAIDVHDIVCKIGQIVVVGGVRRCHPKGSRVLVKGKSFMAIEEVKVDEEVLTNDGWKKVKNVFEQGEQYCQRIIHQNGHIDCTYNHRLAILKDTSGKIEWKQAKDLREGDCLAFPITDSKNADVYAETGKEVNQLPAFTYIKPSHSTTCKDITIPLLDQWMAWFVGNFQCDGYDGLTSKSGELSTAVFGEDKEQAEKTAEQYKRFSVNVTIQKPTAKDNCFKVRVKSKQLGVYMHTNVKQPKTTLRVPHFIKVASQKIKAAYIQGILDADGCVKNHPIQIVVTVYEDFAKDVQSLLYSMGIMTRLKFKPRTQENWQDQYAIVLVNNRDKQRFITLTEGIGFKKFGLQHKTQNTNGWPAAMVDKTALPGGWQKIVASNGKHYSSDKILAMGIQTPLLPVAVKSMQLFLKPVETYDLEVEDNHCFVCEGVLTHNSALISLSDLNNEEMRGAKKGAFWNDHPQRSMANNSAVYNTKPSDEELLAEWVSLIQSRSGERGIFNRSTLATQLPERRVKFLGDKIKTLGTNPCGEIILQSHGLCNLSTIICRPEDTEATLANKIKWASVIGTIQSTFTDFHYVSAKFKKNAEDERLLGVSLTGQMDCKVVREPGVLRMLKKIAVDTNVEYAKRFGINTSNAVTTVKPEGTVSEMCACSPGLHPRYSKWYDRAVRFSSHDPLFQLLKEQGADYFPEVGQTLKNAKTFVVVFPRKAKATSVIQDQITALDLIKYWGILKVNYTEHNPSCTINCGKNEWIGILGYIRDNWSIIGGLAFLPKDDMVYELAPIQPITEAQYEVKIAKFESLKIDLAKLTYYEVDDTAVDVKKEVACSSGQCLYN